MNAPTNDRGHLSSLTLDLLLLSSLPADQDSAARAHLEACASCRGALEELQAEQRQFAASVLPRTLPKVEARVLAPSPLARLSNWWKAAIPLTVAAGAAAALALVVARPGAGVVEDPDLRIKGGPVLQVFAARGEAVFQVKEGTRLKPGDRIRFVVERAGSGPHVTVASIDGARQISLYYPPEGQAGVPLTASKAELPGSIELDDTVGDEQLFAFFSDEALAPESVRQALQRWPAPPELPAKLVTLSFHKEAR